MSKYLQQLDARIRNADRNAAVAVRTIPLNANISLILLLVLIILLTLSGVALIA